MKQEKRLLYLYSILFFVGFLVYANTLNHAYVLDDFSVIKENVIVKQGIAGIPEIFKTHYRQGYGYVQGNLYRPLSLSLFALQWEIAPDSPGFAHLINVLLYGLLLIVLFRLLNEIWKNENLAFLSCLLFALHPIHTEVVANIKSADEILAFGFFLHGFYLFLQHLKKSNKKKLYLAHLFVFLAFLSKESTITFLGLIPLVLILFYEVNWKKALLKTSYFLATFLLYLILRIQALGSLSGDKTIAKIDNLLLNAPNPGIKLATAIKIMGLYLWKLLYPHPLMNDYSFDQIKLSSFTDPYVLLSLLLYGCLIFVLIKTWKSNPIIAFSIGLYLICMSLYSNIFITIGTSFGERLLFVPSLGFCILLAYGFYYPFKEKLGTLVQFNAKSLPMLLLLPVFLLYGFKTMDRNMAWKDNMTLYETDVKNCDKSARCHYYHGLGLMKERALLLPDENEKMAVLKQAADAFTKALEILPTYSDAYGQRGLAYYRMNEFKAAIYDYEQSVKFNPSNYTTWSNLGSLYFQEKKYQEAKNSYEKAIQANPNYVDALANYASTLGTLGDYNTAITYFKKAVSLRPNEPSYYQYIGISYQNLGNQAQANIYLNKSKQLQGN